jgi:hypothetical protein
MADSNQAIEWYLARDGRQHGPVTEVELGKIIELGYLRPTDLVWRQGMAEWALAETVLDLTPPASASANPPPPARSVATPSRPPAPEPAQAESSPRYASHARIEPEQVALRQQEVAQRAPEPDRPEQRRREPTHPQGRGPVAYEAPGKAAQGVGHAHAPQQLPGAREGHVAHGLAGDRGPANAASGARFEAHAPSGASAAAAVPHGHARAPRSAGPAGPQPERAAPIRPVPQAADRDQTGPRGFPWRIAIILVLLSGFAAGGLALHRTGKLANLPFLAAPSVSGGVPVVSRPSAPPRDDSAQVTAAVIPSGSAPAVDADLQKSPLWQRLKRGFPDWYQERVAELSRMSSESKTEREINATMIRWLVDLRRRHHADALAASPGRLKLIAASFVESLAQLSRESTAACYGYISQGEASPAVADLKKPEQRATLDVQLATIFDAVGEGRKSPMKREPPRREDYDLLSSELGKRGWSAADLQLFTDARALSRAAPEKVCQMVQDWFAAQLAIEDEAAKIRLLGEALKPVVAG